MPNHLAKETSPYLLQHSNNPVNWFPWGKSAFKEAREKDKPILLSIGYSACHWCHVMEHESFENKYIAETMNRLFVNIKVDREERPDIDKIYQASHQIITQRGGGWPLTMFLDGDNHEPFFGGTYFPSEARNGLPAFSELLEKISSYYHENREEIHKQNKKLIEILEELEPYNRGIKIRLSKKPLKDANKTFAENFDRDFGGFSPAPKFPNSSIIERLLRDWRDSATKVEPDLESLIMSTLTLTRMANGGIFDHIEGGFFRYSIDKYWQIPHFEKMLYDNGLLMAIYAQASIATGEILFTETANEIANWILSEMKASNGGFFSSLDADSDGKEGLYYLWEPEQIKNLLGKEYSIFEKRFDLNSEPNFDGKWHLAAKNQIDNEDEINSIKKSKKILSANRKKRIKPARDEKQLMSWNALVIKGLAITGRNLNRPDLIEASSKACAFVREKMYINNRLYAAFTNGKTRFPAYLDDHAFMLDALLELLQSNWQTENLNFAIQIADLLLEYFEDKENGAFFFTAKDQDKLIYTPKPIIDEALPSGNGVATFSLQRLGYLIGEKRYINAAENSLKCTWESIEKYPHGHVTLLKALEEYFEKPEIIIIRGKLNEIERWRDSASRLYSPRRMIFAIDENEKKLPGSLKDRKPIIGKKIAYKCAGNECTLPITNWEELVRSLSKD
ncbi:MAG: thioredoxin domain-containing protein [Woeseia sp.]|nr:thioredoxin domain-containing protein [Woeseia sp.]|tara:strand:- start:4343 stop:6373 length:2031 start_codon:yes stop_codon:yes gene_type:complete